MKQQFTPGILSMLPMFYVGWSDSVLSPSEMRLIHKKIETSDFLTDSDKKYLVKWTNPLRPPDEKIFKSWVNTIREHGSKVPDEAKMSLVSLGLEMAKSSIHYKNDELWKSPKTRQALIEIESALGVQHTISTGIMDYAKASPASPCQDCSFEIADMKALLDEPFEDIKDQIRKLLRDPFFEIQHQKTKENYRERVKQQVIELAKQGLSSYAFPRKYGGLEQKGSHISVYEMLGYTDLSLAIKFGVQFGLFGGAIHGLGTEKHHKKYIEALMKAELLGCFAMTETGHGSNVKGLETTAIYDSENDELIVNSPTQDSQKEYIGNGLHSTLAVVFAQLLVEGDNKGVHAVVVPIRDGKGKLAKGVEIEDCGYKMGLNGVDNVRIRFNNVKVPRFNLLDKYGSIDDSGNYTSEIINSNKRFFTMLGALVVGRICVGLLGVNASKTALTIAIKYGANRKQFALKEGMDETLLLDYPSHQRRLLPLLAKTYASYFGLKSLTKRFSESDGSDHRLIETLAAGLKSYATWNATAIIQECREACGGKGYLWENRLADLKADTDIFTTFEGDNTVLMQLVAKGLLTEFKQSFHDEGYRAVIRYLGDRLGARLKELNPIASRNWSKTHLLDFDFIMESFEYREKKLLITLSQRMQSYLKKRIAPHSAFLRCQNHMLVLAEAFIENLILKEFHLVISTCTNENLKTVLTKLFQLYGLHTIETHKGWYLENDYMEGVKTKAIRRVVDKLLQELRPEAIALVDAFAIPEGVLAAEIVS